MTPPRPLPPGHNTALFTNDADDAKQHSTNSSDSRHLRRHHGGTLFYPAGAGTATDGEACLKIFASLNISWRRI